jgi:mannitol-1-/sugar-/sorbitol-6-/2-deoxyglucose-6-phosphatase
MKERAIIFDMDGVIVDSEALWDDIMVEVMQSLGVPFHKGDAEKTRGLRIDEGMAEWYEKYPWEGETIADVANRITDRVTEAMLKNSKAMPGALDAIRAAKETGYKLAIASSAAQRVIEAVVERFEIEGMDFLYSAEHEKKGKPAPDVYLTTAKKLGVDPTECLAVEDSPNGMKAAKAAGMRSLGVIDSRYVSIDEVAHIADTVETSLVGFTKEKFESLFS